MKRKSILLCSLCLAAWIGCTNPIVTSAEEETDTASQEEVYYGVDYGMTWQDTYEYGYMGLNLKLAETLKPLVENQDVLMLPIELPNDSGDKIKFAFFSWDSLTDEQKNTPLNGYMDDFYKWMTSLERIGTIGVYDNEYAEQLDKLTGCTKHTELGTTADGSYTYYLSINEQADATLTEALSQSEVTLTDMTPLTQGASAFSTVRPDTTAMGTFETTDVNGDSYDETLFGEHELTLVNLFATWCSPCVNELPELEKIYQNLGEEYDVGVVGFVLDTVDANFEQTDDTAQSLELAKVLAEKTGATFPFLIPDKTALNGRLLGIDAVPETFFVDKTGAIVGDTYTGARSYEDWEAIIKTELENLKGETK